MRKLGQKEGEITCSSRAVSEPGFGPKKSDVKTQALNCYILLTYILRVRKFGE